MSMKTLTRLSYIDILKIVATFAIVLWHVSAVYVRMDAALLSPLGALPYVINLCVRFALPMFMMISGALLLRERYAFNFKQKFSYIIKLYAVWSLVYVLADQAMRAASGGALLSPAEMLASWIRGPYHFWYLQMLLGVYLLMPLLVRLKGLQTRNYATLLLFVIIYIYNPLSPYLTQAVNDVAGCRSGASWRSFRRWRRWLALRSGSSCSSARRITPRRAPCSRFTATVSSS